MLKGSIPKTKAEQAKVFGGISAASAGGVPAGAGVSISESAVGFGKTTLKFVNTPVPLVDEAGVVAYGSLKVFDFPAGLIFVAGVVANLAVTKSSAGVIAAFDGDFGVGTTAAGNNNALATTEQNLLPTTATPQAVSGATTAKGISSGHTQLDGTATAADVFLNFLVDDADHDVTTTPCNLILNGTVTLVWANAGDK
jgi:hypothetical protein